MLSKYLPRTEFSSYEDFKQNYRVNVPDNFNFGFDIVDGWAEIQDDKPALVWCDDHGNEKQLSFGEISRISNRVANMFSSFGIKKGDRVMTPQMGILDMRHSSAQARSCAYPRFPPAYN